MPSSKRENPVSAESRSQRLPAGIDLRMKKVGKPAGTGFGRFFCMVWILGKTGINLGGKVYRKPLDQIRRLAVGADLRTLALQTLPFINKEKRFRGGPRMVAIQAVVELLGMVPAFVWIGLILVIVLLIVLTVITTKKRSREVAELDKLFADSGDIDQPLALKRRPRKSGNIKKQEGKEAKRKTESDRPSDGASQVKAEAVAEGSEPEEEKGG